MRYFFIISLSLVIFLTACHKPLLTPQIPEIKQCKSPYAFLLQPQITIGENQLLLTTDEVLQHLQTLLQDHCLSITQDKDAYQTILYYETFIDTNTQEKIATTLQKNTAKIKVILTLKKDHVTKTFKSEQSLKIQGKKVLGIGQKTKISKQDQILLLKNTLQSVYQQAIDTFKLE